MRVLTGADKGMYDALNKGAALAVGALIGQINADDWYEQDAVETMVRVYRETCYDAAWGKIKIHTSGGTRIKYAHIGRLWTTSGWCHPAMFSRREILLAFPYSCINMYDDFDYISALKQAGKKLVTVNHLISHFSTGGMSTQKSAAETVKRIKARYSVYRRHGFSRGYLIPSIVTETVKGLLS